MIVYAKIRYPTIEPHRLKSTASFRRITDVYGKCSLIPDDITARYRRNDAKIKVKTSPINSLYGYSIIKKKFDHPARKKRILYMNRFDDFENKKMTANL